MLTQLNLIRGDLLGKILISTLDLCFGCTYNSYCFFIVFRIAYYRLKKSSDTV
jgi:hypothetical protein